MTIKRIKILIYCFTIVLAISFTGCGSGPSASIAATPASNPAGSGSGGNTPSPAPTPTPTATPTPTPIPTAASRFIFGTPGFETQGLEASTIDGATGKVTPVAGGPFDPGLGQSSMIQAAADPQGRFVYTLEVGASAFGNPIGQPGIGEFKINRQTGALDRIAGSPVLFAHRNNSFVAIEGTGHFLYEPNGNSPSTGFDVYAIDQSTGALTKTTSSSNAPPVGENSVASRDGRFLFSNGNGLVESFSINTTNGQLTAIGAPLSTGGSGGAMALASDGKFLYVANRNEGIVAVFSVNPNGALIPVGASFSTGATGIFFAAATPSGKFLYLAFENASGQSVKGFAVDPAEGKFTAIQGGSINMATTITVDSSGKFAYVTLATATNFVLATYSIDPGTGALTQLSQSPSPVSDDPYDVVAVP